jgi:hypothetical protein
MKQPFRLFRSSTFRTTVKQLSAAAVIVVLIIAGMLFRYPQFGGLLVLAYGIFALVARISSGVTFKMVLVILCCLPVLSVRSDDELLDYFAVYAFLLLIIGIVSVLSEVWLPGRAGKLPFSRRIK